MKDNPRLHLDLLQTLLARLEGQANAQPKFPKTAPLLDRAVKKSPAPSADDLRAQIAAAERDIVHRKIHHAQNVLRRHLKQFIKVEPLRIAKRAKNASDDAKKTILDAELKVVEGIDTDAMCVEFLNRVVTRRFAELDLVPGFTRRQLSPAESNVYARFGKSEAVREALKQLSEAIAEIYPDAVPSNGSTEEQARSASAETAAAKLDDFHQFEPEEASKPDDMADGSDEATGEDPFFEQSVAIANTDDEEDDDAPVSNYGPTDEHGLPMLTQGYISGSDDDDFDQPVEPLRPERKNRRGQRARRKIWEQKFGSRANHILKEEREKQRKNEEKERKRQAREQRESASKRRRAELESKPLHPSWEAKRKQLEAQKALAFQGKKKTFD